MTAQLIAIFKAADAEAPMELVADGQLEAGRGLVGDRYHTGNGTFSDELKGKPDVELTLIESEQIDRFNRMSAFIEALPKGLSSEEYFAKFMQDEDFSQEPQPGEGQPGEGGEPGEPGEGQPGQGGQPGQPGTMDSHDGWGEEANEQDRERMAELPALSLSNGCCRR